MRIKIGYELVFDVPAPVSVMLMLYVHPWQAAMLEQPERLTIEPNVEVSQFMDAFGNRVGRVTLPAGKARFFYDNVIPDSGQLEAGIEGQRLHPVDELPHECLPFLLASRYCEVDKMMPKAWELFGKTPPTWQRVQAVMDWVHGYVTFGYPFASPTKSAADVCNDKQGVCRDFQHLAITMMRALNIPARYATGYLGDIGVPPVPSPMDFSAWMEVYLGGKWITLDARHNQRRIGRVLMARGRDAVDVAITTSFGTTTLEKFVVWTDEIKES